MRLLETALEGLLPDATRTLLLRSCLGDSADCRRAWDELQRYEGHLIELFRTDRGELRRLGPLLLDNLRQHDVAMDPRLATVLKTGTLREELRFRICRDVLAKCLALLGGAGISSLLTGGAGLSEWAYRSPWLRHSHDIDLLVASADLEPAASALIAAGFVRDPDGSGTVVQLTHPTSLPVRLATSAYELTGAAGSVEQMSAGSRPIEIDGAPVRIPAAEVSLAHALARAAFSHRRNTLQWACDAWMICARTGHLNPDRFLDAARGSRLIFPSVLLLRYLGRIGAPVSPDLLTASEQEVRRTPPPLERDLALLGLRRGARGGMRSLLRAVPGARTRLALLGWVALPSAAYLRWAYEPASAVSLPGLYIARVAEGLAGLARGGRPHA